MNINISGHLVKVGRPWVMGILNVTPDSFYGESRTMSETAIADRVKKMVEEGVDVIDVGGCSTRPGGTPVTEPEEMERLRTGLQIVKEVSPEVIVSVDTFRPKVALRCLEDFGVHIINDVSGGCEEMTEVLAAKKVPYVLTGGSVFAMAERMEQLHQAGVVDVIVDPGFGFGKTLDENYELMNHLSDVRRLFPEQLMLVGISRKSMIYKVLNCEPKDALEGTVALNMLALERGANILRVHDVGPAVQVVKLWEKLHSLTPNL